MFTLPKLDYDYKALEPHIDAQTMEIHHTKHHQTYIDKLNTALEKYPDLQEKTVEELLTGLSFLPEGIQTPVKNNGGGHYNHSLFWKIMSPTSEKSPTGKTLELINSSFGNFEGFKEKFSTSALNRFGSGWVWLVKNNNALEIMDTPNQDNPLLVGKTPILGLDVWEHAYYLKFQNKRADYVTAWWNVVNWHQVEENLSHV